MIDPLHFPSQQHDQQPQDTGRAQLAGESLMWFNRYKLYRDMGFKRSLRGAVALERERLHTIKGDEPATTSHEEKIKLVEVSYKGVLHSVDLPKQVPGSWKDAAVRFHWQERVHAYESWLLTEVSQRHLQLIARSYANKFERIVALQEMIETTRKSAKQASQSFPIEEIEKAHKLTIAYTKQIRGLLADLRAETKGITDDTLLHWIELFNHAHPDRDTNRTQNTDEK